MIILYVDTVNILYSKFNDYLVNQEHKNLLYHEAMYKYWRNKL